MAEARTITISTRTFIKILAIGLGVLFLYTIRQVLVLVFVALVLSAAIDPFITKLERRRIPRPAGIALIFLAMLIIIGGAIVLFVPLVVDQLTQFTHAFPDLYAKALNAFQSVRDQALVEGFQKGLATLNEALSQVTKGFFTGIVGFFGGLLSVVGVLVMTFYMSLEEKGIKRVAIDLSPTKYRPYLVQLFNRIEDRLGGWLRGQLILGLIIGVVTYIGLLLLGVKYALILAIIAGLTELIPMIGPIVGAIPAVIVAVAQAPWLALAVIVLYLVIQQLENHFIVPKVMSKATGLNPLVVIIAILIGAKVAGVIGIILAVPTVIIVTSFIGDFLEEQRQEDTRLETPA